MKTLRQILMNKNLQQYTLVLIGFNLLIVFLWFRFLRQRLPKEIPLPLSFLGFCIILTTCSIFLYIIISLFRSNKPANPFIKQLSDNIYLPLQALDQYIKNLTFIRKSYNQGIIYVTRNERYKNIKLFYYFFAITPRIFLLTTLLLDVFIFSQLVYIYKIIFIGVLILLGKYIIYTLKYAKDAFISNFKDSISITMDYEYASHLVACEEEEEDEDIPETLVISLEKLISFQTEAILEHNKPYPYVALPTKYDDIFYEKRNIPIPRKFTLKEIDQRINNILQISLFIASYDKVKDSSNKIKNLKVLIYLNYFICWTYILIVSLPSLYYASLWELWILFSIKDLEEPFSYTQLF